MSVIKEIAVLVQWVFVSFCCGFTMGYMAGVIWDRLVDARAAMKRSD